MTVAEFRAAMPAFASATTWPDPKVQAALTSSAIYIGATEWEGFYTEAVMYWVADRLVTDEILANPLAAISGLETLKMIGREMVQRDSRIIMATMADPYLLTFYGRKYRALVAVCFGGTTVSA